MDRDGYMPFYYFARKNIKKKYKLNTIILHDIIYANVFITEALREQGNKLIT